MSAALLDNSASQAVVAFENVRLFDGVQARNRDLSECRRAAGHQFFARRTRVGLSDYAGERRRASRS